MSLDLALVARRAPHVLEACFKLRHRKMIG